jgi:predicted ester cyclase
MSWTIACFCGNVYTAPPDRCDACGSTLDHAVTRPTTSATDGQALAARADFRAAFPELAFGATAELIAEGDYVVGQWRGGGTHTGDAFDDMPIGSLPASTGKTMRFTGSTVLKVENGLITEEIGLDDGITALTTLGLIPQN